MNGRFFKDNEMKSKAARWIKQMCRAQEGIRLKNDQIPADLDEAKVLADKLFTPGDAQVLKNCLDLAFTPKGG